MTYQNIMNEIPIMLLNTSQSSGGRAQTFIYLCMMNMFFLSKYLVNKDALYRQLVTAIVFCLSKLQLAR